MTAARKSLERAVTLRRLLQSMREVEQARDARNVQAAQRAVNGWMERAQQTSDGTGDATERAVSGAEATVAALQVTAWAERAVQAKDALRQSANRAQIATVAREQCEVLVQAMRVREQAAALKREQHGMDERFAMRSAFARAEMGRESAMLKFP